jgi:hypothetical protein
MTSGSFLVQTPLFIQRREDAVRHVNALAKGLKQVGMVGVASGAVCGVMAVLLGRVLNTQPHSSSVPGSHGMSGFTLVAVIMATALIVLSCLYLVAGWGLSLQKSWARYTAAATFTLKLVLCLWLGHVSIGAMVIFLMVSAWDIYGLWVLLSKQTGQLFSSPQVSQAPVGSPETC